MPATSTSRPMRAISVTGGTILAAGGPRPCGRPRAAKAITGAAVTATNGLISMKAGGAITWDGRASRAGTTWSALTSTGGTIHGPNTITKRRHADDPRPRTTSTSPRMNGERASRAMPSGNIDLTARHRLESRASTTEAPITDSSISANGSSDPGRRLRQLINGQTLVTASTGSPRSAPTAGGAITWKSRRASRPPPTGTA